MMSLPPRKRENGPPITQKVLETLALAATPVLRAGGLAPDKETVRRALEVNLRHVDPHFQREKMLTEGQLIGLIAIFDALATNRALPKEQRQINGALRDVTRDVCELRGWISTESYHERVSKARRMARDDLENLPDASNMRLSRSNDPDVVGASLRGHRPPPPKPEPDPPSGPEDRSLKNALIRAQRQREGEPAEAGQGRQALPAAAVKKPALPAAPPSPKEPVILPPEPAHPPGNALLPEDAKPANGSAW